MRFYLTFGFLGFKIVNKGTMNLFKGSEDFRKNEKLEYKKNKLKFNFKQFRTTRCISQISYQ